MGARACYQALPILICGLTIALTAAAIEFLPETLYFPVVEYSMPGDIQIGMHHNGELDKSSCEQVTKRVAGAVRANCAACTVVERCFSGLNAERRKILSVEALPAPSARTPGGNLTMIFSIKDAALALGVCRQTEQQSAGLPPQQRLRCYPASMPR